MNFWLGCNYWASNAGTDMWIKWDETAIRSDLDILTANGVEYMRVFPNWRDFQPVKKLYNYAGTFEEYVMEDGSAPTNPYFIDEKMIERFSQFCDICAEYNIKLIVGVLTGWMSGTMLIPSALNDKNLFTNPTALLFEQRFIKGFVTALKDKKSIIAWDLGNECNCMSTVDSCRDYSKCDVSSGWTYTISNAIKACDNTRPVVSGMASLSPEREKARWSLQEHGECIDILTTHPYTYFQPHCSNDYYKSIRSTMHATAQTRYYSDISGKPCFVEEIGTLGCSLCSDETSADFMRVNLYSNWANDNGGVLWWCANEQNELTNVPYSWGMLEVELGLISADRKPKKYLTEMKEFSSFLKGLDFSLPAPRYDAVCIVPRGYEEWDTWGVIFSAYILAKQAKLNLKFVFSDDELPEADTYILPSMRHFRTLKFYELKKRVKKGASLYISSNGAFIQDLKGFAGIEIIDSASTMGRVEFDFSGRHFSVTANRQYKTRLSGAEALALDTDGNPVITRNKFGEGEVFYVNVPLESSKMNEFDAFSDGSYLIYSELLGGAKSGNVIDSDNPNLCITHHFEDSICYCVIVNHSEAVQPINMKVNGDYALEKIYKGDTESVKPFDAVVLKFIKK